MRVVFMGTPAFAATALAALLESAHTVIAAYTRPPRPAGRGRAERRSAVHELAEARGIPARTPKTLRDAEVQRAFAALGAEICVVAAYGLILPGPILEAPRLGCVNVHASLLPRWRGAAPIHHAILAGDVRTGITIMRMDEGLDTGPILMAEETAIAADDTFGTLHDRLALLGARLVVTALDRLAAGTLEPRPQPEEGACYAPRLAPADGRLDWRERAPALARRVRAFAPAPGAWFEHDGVRLKVLAAEAVAEAPGAAPGIVLDGAPTVACAEGGLRLLALQRAGRKPQGAAAFLRGFPLPAGTRLALPAEGAGAVP